MNPTTPQPAARALQSSLRHLHRLALAGGLALTLLGAAAVTAGPVAAAAGDPSQWGAVSGKDPEFPVTPNLARKVNEYEGQHRLGVAGDPSQWGLAGGKDPEYPTTPGLARKVNEYEGQHR
jgi:hypothetical protein